MAVILTANRSCHQADHHWVASYVLRCATLHIYRSGCLYCRGCAGCQERGVNNRVGAYTTVSLRYSYLEHLIVVLFHQLVNLLLPQFLLLHQLQLHVIFHVLQLENIAESMYM